MTVQQIKFWPTTESERFTEEPTPEEWTDYQKWWDGIRRKPTRDDDVVLGSDLA